MNKLYNELEQGQEALLNSIEANHEQIRENMKKYIGGEMTTQKRILGAIKKIAQEMQGYVFKKDLVLDKNGNPLQQVRSSDKIMEILKPLLIQNDICIEQNVESMTVTEIKYQNGTNKVQVSLAMAYTFRHLVDDSHIITRAVGDGQGNDASTIASTMAMKSACLTLFGIHFESLTVQEVQEVKNGKRATAGSVRQAVPQQPRPQEQRTSGNQRGFSKLWASQNIDEARQIFAENWKKGDAGYETALNIVKQKKKEWGLDEE